MKHKKKYLYFNNFLLFEDFFNEYLPAVNTLEKRITKKENILKRGDSLKNITPIKFQEKKNIIERNKNYIKDKDEKKTAIQCLIEHETEVRAKLQKNPKKFNKKILEEKIIWSITIVERYNQIIKWKNDDSIKRRCLKVILNELFLLSYGSRRGTLFGFKSSF